jgi:hypothetical protein
MADNKVVIDPRYLTYNKEEVEGLLDEVKNRSFLRDMTEEEYEALTNEEKNNGDLYLLHEQEE